MLKINCYKVVFVSGKKKVSYLASFMNIPEYLTLTYKVRIPTVPEIGKIFVYDTLDSALKDMKRSIISGTRPLQLWAAYGTDLEIAPRMLAPYLLQNPLLLTRFWEHFRYINNTLTEFTIPGTMFASSVTLIKQIPVNK